MQRMIRITNPHITRRGLLLLAPATGLALLAAACGNSTSGGGYGAAPSSSNPAASAGGAVTVTVRTSGLGQILTDGQGKTVYLFEKEKAGVSSCDGSCAGVWPPVTTSGAAQSSGTASALLVSTTTRTDGKVQVTYNGHPLYYYVGDGKPGDTNGQNLDQFGAGWYVLNPAGSKIDQ
jgi:predicted lipoprotein with Yx(FWY)xxD motif